MRCCEALFPNADARYLGHTATAMRRFIQNVWHNVDSTLCTKTGAMVFLYSDVDMAGRKTFVKAFQHFCDTYELPTAPAGEAVLKYASPKFSRSLVALSNTLCFYWGSKEFSVFKKILNNEQYPVIPIQCFTGKPRRKAPVLFKSICSFLVRSNDYPPGIDEDCFGVVMYNAYKLGDKELEAMEQSFSKLNSDNQPYSDELIAGLFSFCPFDYDYENPVDIGRDATKQVMEHFIQRLRDGSYQGFLRKCKGLDVRSFAITVYDYFQPSRCGYSPDLSRYIRYWREAIVYWDKQGLIKAVSKLKNPVIYRGYDWLDIINNLALDKLASESSSYPLAVKWELDPLKRTALAWDYLIAKEREMLQASKNNPH